VLKLLIKLAAAALIANACWRLGSAYATFYRFRDAVEQSAQFSGGRSEGEVTERVIELASQYDVPLASDAFTVRRDANHTYIDGEYQQPVELAPGYTRRWTFKWNIHTYTAVPPKLAPQ
jgi:hypothetical protein